jgi:hypothetical protein
MLDPFEVMIFLLDQTFPEPHDNINGIENRNSRHLIVMLFMILF